MGKLKAYLLEQFELGYGVDPNTFEPHPLENTEALLNKNPIENKSNPIDSLMYHSGLTAQGCWDQFDNYDQQAILKFAELIIKECAEIAACNGHVSGFALKDLIKNHFNIYEME